MADTGLAEAARRFEQEMALIGSPNCVEGSSPSATEEVQMSSDRLLDLTAQRLFKETDGLLELANSVEEFSVSVSSPKRLPSTSDVSMNSVSAEQHRYRALLDDLRHKKREEARRREEKLTAQQKRERNLRQLSERYSSRLDKFKRQKARSQVTAHPHPSPKSDRKRMTATEWAYQERQRKEAITRSIEEKRLEILKKRRVLFWEDRQRTRLMSQTPPRPASLSHPIESPIAVDVLSLSLASVSPNKIDDDDTRHQSVSESESFTYYSDSESVSDIIALDSEDDGLTTASESCDTDSGLLDEALEPIIRDQDTLLGPIIAEKWTRRQRLRTRTYWFDSVTQTLFWATSETGKQRSASVMAVIIGSNGHAPRHDSRCLTLYLASGRALSIRFKDVPVANEWFGVIDAATHPEPF